MELLESSMPSAEDIRAARAYRGWSQEYLGDLVGLTKRAILNIENRKYRPTLENLKKIRNAFLGAGIVFHGHGGFTENKNIVQVLTGPDSYLDLQIDMLNTPNIRENEVLYNGADEKLSSDSVIEKEQEMYAKGVTARNLIKDGDTFILGKIENYRWIPKEYFSSNDVTVIYGNKVAFCISDRGVMNHIIIINDKRLATAQRLQFDKLWNIGKVPSHSTVKHRYNHQG